VPSSFASFSSSSFVSNGYGNGNAGLDYSRGSSSNTAIPTATTSTTTTTTTTSSNGIDGMNVGELAQTLKALGRMKALWIDLSPAVQSKVANCLST
jgi:hypothetical protein